MNNKRGHHPAVDLEYRSQAIARVRAAHPNDADIVVVLHMAERWIAQRVLERARNHRYEAKKERRAGRSRRRAGARAGAAEVAAR